MNNKEVALELTKQLYKNEQPNQDDIIKTYLTILNILSTPLQESKYDKIVILMNEYNEKNAYCNYDRIQLISDIKDIIGEDIK